jgi:UDP-N-acetylglucosamine 1-carboxyvinyltransferase
MPAVQYIVEGGRTLHGTIRPSGNKNAALPIVAAALLSENVVRLDNVPHIRDIETLIQLIRSVGVSIDWTAPNSLAIHASEVHARISILSFAPRFGASILLAAPLLARCGEITLPPPEAM